MIMTDVRLHPHEWETILKLTMKDKLTSEEHDRLARAQELFRRDAGTNAVKCTMCRKEKSIIEYRVFSNGRRAKMCDHCRLVNNYKGTSKYAR